MGGGGSRKVQNFGFVIRTFCLLAACGAEEAAARVSSFRFSSIQTLGFSVYGVYKGRIVCICMYNICMYIYIYLHIHPAFLHSSP